MSDSTGDKYSIPQYIDEPMKFVIWTVDEVLAFLIPIGISTAVFNQPLIGLIISSLIVYGLHKVKGEQGHYFMFHLIYWFFPDSGQLKATPPSYVRELIG